MKLLDEVRAEQTKHADWTFERTWDHLQIVRPEMFVQAEHKPLETRDSRLTQEFAKHKRLEDSKKSEAIDAHAERLKKIHKLMKERNLDFTTAFTLVCEEENGLKATPATAARPAAPTATVKKTGELMLVCAIEASALEKIEAGWR